MNRWKGRKQMDKQDRASRQFQTTKMDKLDSEQGKRDKQVGRQA